MESYKNDKSVCEVITTIAEEIENENLEKVAHCYFVSFFCDRSTDSSTTEKEVMLIIFLDPTMHKVQLKFFYLRNAISQSSEVLMETFLETFQSKGVSDITEKKISYFPSDSANVNSGLKNGLITKMCENFGDLISFVWRLAHRLELAIKDKFKGSDMTEIERVLNLFYNTYKNSSKK